jgi:hypothetical protein
MTDDNTLKLEMQLAKLPVEFRAVGNKVIGRLHGDGTFEGDMDALIAQNQEGHYDGMTQVIFVCLRHF